MRSRNSAERHGRAEVLVITARGTHRAYSVFLLTLRAQAAEGPESVKLKKLLADAMLDNAALKDPARN